MSVPGRALAASELFKARRGVGGGYMSVWGFPSGPVEVWNDLNAVYVAAALNAFVESGGSVVDPQTGARVVAVLKSGGREPCVKWETVSEEQD